MDSLWLMIILMSAITFSVRFAFFTNWTQSGLAKPVREFLSFTAPAVLTAMWVPIVFAPEMEGDFNWLNPYLIAGLFTIAMCFVTKQTLVVVVSGMALFLGVSYLGVSFVG